MNDDDSRCIDRQAKHVLSRAVQSDTRIKDLDVSQPHFFSSISLVATHVFNPILFSFFQSKLREHLGNFRAIESSIKGALAELNVCDDTLTRRFLNRLTPPPKKMHTEECTAGRPSFEFRYPKTA